VEHLQSKIPSQEHFISPLYKNISALSSEIDPYERMLKAKEYGMYLEQQYIDWKKYSERIECRELFAKVYALYFRVERARLQKMADHNLRNLQIEGMKY